jgi:hypothetical protein
MAFSFVRWSYVDWRIGIALNLKSGHGACGSETSTPRTIFVHHGGLLRLRDDIDRYGTIKRIAPVSSTQVECARKISRRIVWVCVLLLFRAVICAEPAA